MTGLTDALRNLPWAQAGNRVWHAADQQTGSIVHRALRPMGLAIFRRSTKIMLMNALCDAIGGEW